MKLKFKFVIKKMCEQIIAIPAGDMVVDFNGLLRINETAAFIIEKLNVENSVEELIFAVSEKFDCDKDMAVENVEYVVNILKEANLLME